MVDIILRVSRGIYRRRKCFTSEALRPVSVIFEPTDDTRRTWQVVNLRVLELLTRWVLSSSGITAPHPEDKTVFSTLCLSGGHFGHKEAPVCFWTTILYLARP